MTLWLAVYGLEASLSFPARAQVVEGQNSHPTYHSSEQEAKVNKELDNHKQKAKFPTIIIFSFFWVWYVHGPNPLVLN